MTDRSAILEQARAYARSELERDSSGHDWWHIVRVTRTAKALAALEQADEFVCELAALLHDIADEKLNGSKEAGLRKVTEWMERTGVPTSEREHVADIVATMSYGGGDGRPMATLEGRIVQDADRLDALGAIGIARTFAYSGWKGQLVYDPGLRPRQQMSREEYRSGRSTAINHFYEKLLKLKGLMNTEAGRALAEERHQFMELYLRQFDKEWELGNEAYLQESSFSLTGIRRVHIAFGDSAGGSLRIALREQPGEKVVVLGDDLMVGPLGFELPQLWKKRMNWWGESINEREKADMEAYVMKAALNWLHWPDRLQGLPVVVWAGDSAGEQTALRCLLNAMSDDADISLVNPTSLLNRRFPEAEYRCMGEISPEKLCPLLEEAELLTPAAREAYAADWRRLAAEEGVLRVAENGQLRTVPEHYFDGEIVKAARKLKALGGRYIKSARLIGEVIGHSDQRVSDSFIEYRVRRLIEQGVMDYTGELEAMRYYSVSLTGRGEEMADAAGSERWNERLGPELENAADWLEQLGDEAEQLEGSLTLLASKLAAAGGQAASDEDAAKLQERLAEYLQEQRSLEERRKELEAALRSVL